MRFVYVPFPEDVPVYGVSAQENLTAQQVSETVSGALNGGYRSWSLRKKRERAGSCSAQTRNGCPFCFSSDQKENPRKSREGMRFAAAWARTVPRKAGGRKSAENIANPAFIL